MNFTKRAARAALGALALAAATAADAQVTRSYDFAATFRADPTLETAEWEVLRSEGPAGALTPLETFRTDVGVVPGLQGYMGTESCNVHGCFPMIAVNTTGAPAVVPYTGDTLVVPEGAVFVHPANPENGLNGNAAVGFRSPFTGWVRVTIALTRIHFGLVSWQVDLDGQVLQPSAPLGYPEVGTYAVEQLKVKKGSLLAVRVDSADGYGADSSTVSFTVERVPGPEE